MACFHCCREQKTIKVKSETLFCRFASVFFPLRVFAKSRRYCFWPRLVCRWVSERRWRHFPNRMKSIMTASNCDRCVVTRFPHPWELLLCAFALATVHKHFPIRTWYFDWMPEIRWDDAQQRMRCVAFTWSGGKNMRKSGNSSEICQSNFYWLLDCCENGTNTVTQKGIG